MESMIVPSSIQRIRAFLVEMCGMKVKPWASSEETLAALHATLMARHACPNFWAALRTLLENLAQSLKARRATTPGAVVDNEILSDERYADLLDEIRACLATQSTDVHPAAFRRLAKRLSAPALGLLLLLAGVATIGCDGSSLAGSKKTDAAADARLDSSPDRVLSIVFPEVLPPQPDLRPLPADAAAATSGPDGGAVTVREIMDSCNIPNDTQGRVLGCLASLSESWKTGMTDYLAGKNCADVAAVLGQCSSGTRCNSYLPKDFDPNQMVLCEPALVYVGVRFV